MLVFAGLAASLGCLEITEVVPDPAEPGETITIHGSQLGAVQGSRVVTHGDDVLTITSWSATEIVATLPSDKPAGTFDLVVAGPGQSASLSHTVDIEGMRYVPAGTFTMGSDVGDEDEGPAHLVHLDGYWIDTAETTVAEFAECLAARRCKLLQDPPSESCNLSVPGREDHPMNCLSWVEANTYCEWAGKRLPSEAQWEKAARGTDARTFPWGEEPPTCDYAVMDDPAAGGNGCGAGSTLPVGSKPLGDSPYGVWDMAGNVYEYVSDWYAADYYATSPFSNPEGPETGTLRIPRGGGWVHVAQNHRTWLRLRHSPRESYIWNGVRCARDGGAP